MITNIPAPKPVNFIHTTGPDYGRISLRITIRGMEITAVALDSNLHPIGKTFEHEIQTEAPNIGLDFLLPPDSYLVVRDLPELIKKYGFNGTLANRTINFRWMLEFLSQRFQDPLDDFDVNLHIAGEHLYWATNGN